MALTSTSKLADLVALVGNQDILAEYEELLADRARLSRLLAAIDAVRKEQADPVVEAVPETAEGAENPRGDFSRPKIESWSHLSPQEQVECQLSWLEFKLAHPGTSMQNGEWRGHIEKWFGHYKPEFGKSLRAAVANTSGAFRPRFVERIKRAFGADAEAYLARLARIPDPPKDRDRG
jgi:hypothetical protein